MGCTLTEYTWISVSSELNFLAIWMAVSRACSECSEPSSATRIFSNNFVQVSKRMNKELLRYSFSDKQVRYEKLESMVCLSYKSVK
jgi:hypothetical protein